MRAKRGIDTQVLNSFAAGSLAAEAAGLLALLVPGKSTSIYSVANYATQTYIRNPSFWGYGLDFTAVPASLSYAQDAKKGTVAMTKRHIAMAAHYQLAVGDKLHYVTQDNVCVVATLASKQTITNDLCLGTLTADLPDTITPIKLLPADWRTHVGNPYGTYTNLDGTTVYWSSHVPAFFFNQSRHAYVLEVNGTFQSIEGIYIVSERYPDTSPGVDFTGAIISGDSGGGLLLDRRGAGAVGADVGSARSNGLCQIPDANQFVLQPRGGADGGFELLPNLLARVPWRRN